MPEVFEDETMGCIQFAVSFQEKYGGNHPDFFPGTLEQAFKDACFKPAKDVRPVDRFREFSVVVFETRASFRSFLSEKIVGRVSSPQQERSHECVL